MLSILAPVFLIIALGAWLSWRGALTASALRELNQLCYWWGLPALLFIELARTQPDTRTTSGLLVVCVLTTLCGIGLAYAVGRCLGLPKLAIGTFVQASFRGNLAFIGLPVAMYAFNGAVREQASTLLTLGPLVALYNILAVVVLQLSQPQALLWRSALRSLVTNPILLACIAGLTVSAVGISLPTWLIRSGNALGQMALPLALLGIGGALVHTPLQGRIGPACWAAGLKVLVLPWLGCGLGYLWGLSYEQLQVALILLACPSASASYVLVQQLKGDSALAASAIVLSSLLALPGFAWVLSY